VQKSTFRNKVFFSDMIIVRIARIQGYVGSGAASTSVMVAAEGVRNEAGKYP
jgi:hypothetical protein